MFAGIATSEIRPKFSATSGSVAMIAASVVASGSDDERADGAREGTRGG